MAANLICSIPECGKHVVARGWCTAHYSRFKRQGDPLKKGKDRGGAIKFLQETVLPYKGNECIFWPYSKTGADGAGWVSWNGRGSRVPRVVCAEVHGPAPSRLHEAAHSCGKGHLACCTPNHLRWATPIENANDKLEHGTVSRGERQGSSKLSRQQVREIRALEGVLTLTETARKFDVGLNHVKRIQKRERWAWLD